MDQLQKLSLPFTPKEVEDTVLSLFTQKSPILDRFTNDYYKKFHKFLSPRLTEVFNTAATLGSFPTKMLQAVVLMIPSPGKDLYVPESYRSISLLNSNIKIYAKTLAKRLMYMLHSIMNPDQVGLVVGRLLLMLRGKYLTFWEPLGSVGSHLFFCH